MMSRKMELKKRVTILTLQFEPLLNIVALINLQTKQLMDVVEARNTPILFCAVLQEMRCRCLPTVLQVHCSGIPGAGGLLQ